MRLITSQKQREVFAWEDGEEWMISPFEEAQSMRRPIGRFNSRNELLTYAKERGVKVIWQTR